MANHTYGLWGYTGVGHGDRPLTIQSTGIGGAAVALVIAELAGSGTERVVGVREVAGAGGGPVVVSAAHGSTARAPRSAAAGARSRATRRSPPPCSRPAATVFVPRAWSASIRAPRRPARSERSRPEPSPSTTRRGRSARGGAEGRDRGRRAARRAAPARPGPRRTRTARCGVLNERAARARQDRRRGAYSAESAQRVRLTGDVVQPVLEILEPAGERAQSLFDALDVGGGGEVQRSHRRPLRLCCALAGAQRLLDRRVEDGVLDQRLRELADGLLAACPQIALVVGFAHRPAGNVVDHRSLDGRPDPSRPTAGLPIRNLGTQSPARADARARTNMCTVEELAQASGVVKYGARPVPRCIDHA